MLKNMIAFIQKMFDTADKSQTYGSELERYVMSKGPQSVAEIDHWTRQFDRNQKQRGWL